MTNQEARQIASRAVTSATETLTGDWHALFDTVGVPVGTGTSINERMLAWINDQLSSSYSNLNGAMYAYAADQSFDNWSSMGNGVDFSDATP